MGNKLRAPNACFGCAACSGICPVNCIKMNCNSEGFYVPEIDTGACIQCGKCVQVCQAITTVEHDQQISAYAAWSENQETRFVSSSGGVFSEISNFVFEQKGVVFGALYDNSLRVVHKGIQDKKDLYMLRGSKYVQSDTQNTFNEAKQYLENGRIVLYSGTPCQIAALKAFLGRKYMGLITVDLICHGVPSPVFLKKYIEYEERQKGQPIIDINFRDKTKNGWGISTVIHFSSQVYRPLYSEYLWGFLHDFLYNSVCYKCPFATTLRVSDITLGDCWGVEEVIEQIDSRWGVSAVLVNSKAGADLLDSVKTISKIAIQVENISKNNGNLRKPSAYNPIRAEVYKDLDNKSFDMLKKEYFNSAQFRVDQFKQLLPIEFKRNIKSFFKRIMERNSG